MKVKYKMILALILALALAVCMGSCGKKDAEETADTSADTQTEEAAEEKPAEELPEVVKTIEGVDENIGDREPLQIDTITLYADGSVAIVPLDDLRKNEIKDDAEAVYPFEESGKVEDVAVADYGNGGYRTLIALMEDGTLSAISAKDLIEEHILVVMPNLTGRDNYVSVEQVENEDAFGVIGKTDNDEDIELDYALDF